MSKPEKTGKSGKSGKVDGKKSGVKVKDPKKESAKVDKPVKKKKSAAAAAAAAEVPATKPPKKGGEAEAKGEGLRQAKADRIAAKKAKRERIAAKKEKAAKAGKGEKPAARVPDAILGADVPMIQAVMKLTPKDVCKKAVEIHKGIHVNQVQLAAMLHVIKEKEYYKELDYSNFKDFVEAEFNMSVRSVYDKVEWYNTLLLEHKQDPVKVEKLGPTKAGTICKAIKDGKIQRKRIEATIDGALKKTDKELKSDLKMPPKGKGDSEGGDDPTKNVAGSKGKSLDVNIRLVGEIQVEAFQNTVASINAVEGNKELSGSEILMRLCTEYQASTIKEAKHPIAYYLRILKENYPEQKIVAFPLKYSDRVLAHINKLLDEDKGKKHKSQGKNPKVPAEKGA